MTMSGLLGCCCDAEMLGRTHLGYHNDARLVWKYEVVGCTEIGRCNWAQLHGYATICVLHGDLEVIVAARLEATLQHNICLTDRIVLGAWKRFHLDGRRRCIAHKLKGQWIVELLVSCTQSIDYRADLCVGRHQHQPHARGGVEFGIHSVNVM